MKSRHLGVPRCILLGIKFLAAFVPSIFAVSGASGAATYVFVSANFDQSVGTSCPPVCHITGSFTVAQPLAPNLMQDVGGSGAFKPLSFTFTDGVTTITQLNATSSGFAVHTDANGKITQWGMYMSGPGGGAGISIYYGGAENLTQNGVNLLAYQAYFQSATSPGGSWSVAGVNSGDLREITKSYTDSFTPLTVSWTPVFPDTNYTAACTAETKPSDFLLPTITSRAAGSMTVSPTEGGSPAGILDCIAIPDYDSTDLRHGRGAFSGSPASVVVKWNAPFPDTNYTAVCTVETDGAFGGGFTGVIDAVSPGSVTVLNAGYPAGTMHCMAVPDADSSNVRHARVPLTDLTVTVTWNSPFPDSFYVATCKQRGSLADQPFAIAIQAGSKLPGSMKVVSDVADGTVHCIAVHISGDTNGDGLVNCSDLDIVEASFGKKSGQTGFDPRADVNGDGIVNILDLSIVAKQAAPGTACQ